MSGNNSFKNSDNNYQEDNDLFESNKSSGSKIYKKSSNASYRPEAKNVNKPKTSLKTNKSQKNNRNPVKKKRTSSTGDVSTIFMSFGGNVIRLSIDVILYMILIIALVLSCRYAYNFCFQVFGSASVTDKDNAYSMSITISEGESTMDVATRLEEFELILDKYSFSVKAKLDKSSIKPGTFIIGSDMDYDDILETISDFSNAIDEENIGDEINDSNKSE